MTGNGASRLQRIRRQQVSGGSPSNAAVRKTSGGTIWSEACRSKQLVRYTAERKSSGKVEVETLVINEC